MRAPDAVSAVAARLGPYNREVSRVIRVWRDLPHERRLAGLACGGLFLTLFLPWYQETVFANGVSTLRSASSSLTGWGAFSFVEAAVLLVAACVLLLLYLRAQGRAFHVPGGDGGLITAAGLWTCALIVWRIFDKQGTSRQGQIAYTSGIEWGIFVALAVAALLAYAGSLIRLAHEPEPPLPGEVGPSGRRAHPGPDMGADEHWTQELRTHRAPATPVPAPLDASEPPTRRVRPRSIAADPARSAPDARLEADPEAPTERQRRRGPDASDDQLTIRLDRPD